MRNQVWTALVLCALLAFIACQPCEEETEADIAAIEALVQQWCASAEAGDLAGVMATYSDDIVRMPADEPTIVGKAANEDLYRNAFSLSLWKMTWPIEGTSEIIVAGDWAFHRSEFMLEVTPKGEGETIELRGKIVEICQRQTDGSWKFAREIWNRNSPSGQ